MDYDITAEGLEKTYYTGSFMKRRAAVKALNGLSFRVRRGEVYGLLGPNGAGKTTTVKIVSTLMTPDKGYASVLGHDVVREYREVRRVIGVMLSVERGFFWKLTGEENLRYFGMLYGLGGRELEERIKWALDMVGLTELGGDKKFFEDMSLGMRARLGLARVLIKDPRVMILDEPTLGLDPHSARHIRSLLREEARKGKTILVTTHNMFEAEIMCDRVGIIRDGRIIAEGTPQELKVMVSSKTPISITARSGDPVSVEKLVTRLRESGIVEAVDYERTAASTWRLKLLVPAGMEDEAFTLIYTVSKDNGVRVVESKVRETTLEDVFIALTSAGESGAEA